MQLIKPSYQILTPINTTDILTSLEYAARTCYKSEDKITSESAPKFCKMLLNRNHESTIEHISLTVKFIVCRGFTHELVRHRLASFSQESTRYCDYNKKGITFIIPPWLDLSPGIYRKCVSNGYSVNSGKIEYDDSTPEHMFVMSCLHDEYTYNKFLNIGWTPQQAREVLPIGLKAEIVMTANLRELRHVLKLRTNVAAHPQMREIMRPLLDEMKEKLPVIFEDINY